MIELLKRGWRSLQRRWRGEPGDPYARVLVPLRRGPGGNRDAAVALDEPPEYLNVRAFGRPLR
jgi:hypothetical protein